MDAIDQRYVDKSAPVTWVGIMAGQVVFLGTALKQKKNLVCLNQQLGQS